MKTTYSTRTLTAIISALVLLAAGETPALQQADEAQKPEAAATADKPQDAASSAESEAQASNGKSRRNRHAVVVFGHNAILKSNEVAEAVVVIGGSAKVYG